MSSKDGYPIGYSSSVINTFKKRSANKEARFLLPHLKKTDHLLDCGCGPGSITLDFATILSQGSVTGIDIEPSQVEDSKNLMQEKGIANATFQTADILKLPFENSTSDRTFNFANHQVVSCSL